MRFFVIDTKLMGGDIIGEIQLGSERELQYRPASKKLKYRLEAGFLILLGA